MVEKDSENTKAGRRMVDWMAAHDLWTQGHDAAWIADQYGVNRRTIADRCAWIDAHFPPFAPVRFKAALARRLDEALVSLERGEAVEAERRAKALQAILRAAAAVEEWIMDNDTAAKPAEPAPEANAHDDPRAELERRLGNLLDHELKRRAARGGAADARSDAGSADGRSGGEDAAGEPLDQ
ncbi:MAG: hypothetical protein NXI12_04925 [Alphaproteobacteria bacterium]|nr:hypothetical protein [Alphaproteobacteria bacterium]